LLFDKQDGAAFAWGRIPVGASDYALERYSLNETAGDYAMASFSIDHDKTNLIPYIKAALDVRPDITFWASPWSPPTWMKDNGAFDKGSIKNDPETLQAHALYLTRFVEEYAKQGIQIHAVAPQNEAGWAQAYPSCAWTPAQMADYIGKYLGPTLASHNLDTEIWLATLSNATNRDAGNSPDDDLGKAVLADATAKSFVKGIGLQWAMSTKVSDYLGKSVPVYQTEHQAGNNPWDFYSGDGAEKTAYLAVPAPNDYGYADESWGWLKDWIGKGVNAYSAWNMVLDTDGLSLDTVRPWKQNALLTVDVQAAKLNVTPTYYVFRHLSQYVEPGAVRIATAGSDDALAFKNSDQSIVTVVYNSSAQAKTTTLAVRDKTYVFSVPAHGIVTVNLQR
jgi:glucosylceramidase